MAIMLELRKPLSLRAVCKKNNTGRNRTIGKGTYTAERIPNPKHSHLSDWLVISLEGKHRYGASISFLEKERSITIKGLKDSLPAKKAA